jgi:hypothetical protein
MPTTAQVNISWDFNKSGACICCYHFSISAPEGTYPKGIRDVFKNLIKTEGPLALYKGITPVLLRAFPANAACFVGFELCKTFLTYLSKSSAD